MQADESLEKALVTLHTFGFTTILRPPGAEAEKHAKAIAHKLGVGDVITEPRLCCPCASADVEWLFPILQEVYTQRCVLGEESCLISLPTDEQAFEALQALGRWFLGREPHGASPAESAARPLWATISLLRFQFAGSSAGCNQWMAYRY